MELQIPEETVFGKPIQIIEHIKEQEEGKMKKVLSGMTPILLLVLALTFMTNYKQLDDLSDSERYQIRSYVEAAENGATADSEPASAQEEE